MYWRTLAFCGISMSCFVASRSAETACFVSGVAGGCANVEIESRSSIVAGSYSPGDEDMDHTRINRRRANHGLVQLNRRACLNSVARDWAIGFALGIALRPKEWGESILLTRHRQVLIPILVVIAVIVLLIALF